MDVTIKVGSGASASHLNSRRSTKTTMAAATKQTKLPRKTLNATANWRWLSGEHSDPKRPHMPIAKLARTQSVPATTGHPKSSPTVSPRRSVHSRQGARRRQEARESLSDVTVMPSLSVNGQGHTMGASPHCWERFTACV